MEHHATILDASGASHVYTITRHRGSEGAPLCQHLLALVIEPIAAGAGPMVVRAVTAGGVKGLLENPEVLGALDFGALSRGIRSSLLSLPMPTVLAVLRYTNRDGKPLVADNGQATPAFDEAYAGNYTELGQALWGACSHNGFFPGLDTFGRVAKKALAAMRETPKSAG